MAEKLHFLFRLWVFVCFFPHSYFYWHISSFLHLSDWLLIRIYVTFSLTCIVSQMSYWHNFQMVYSTSIYSFFLFHQIFYALVYISKTLFQLYLFEKLVKKKETYCKTSVDSIKSNFILGGFSLQWLKAVFWFPGQRLKSDCSSENTEF